ncbi:MAG TPA: hypothetical protein VK983_00575 [Candidatus Limnocylindrales bacterium]|nr:hypothetical protein [Candidatus Limnocylindrales bacterium]
MKNRLLYRNVRAGELLDIFLISAIACVLLTRAYLHLTGYPQIGSGEFHFAHMLWGGILMPAAIVIQLSFLGMQAQRLAALIGGVGFGFLIDEVGKLITSDNDYFFRPAIGIIYAVFVIMYLTFSFLSRRERYSSREYQLNALVQLEEAVLHDMDPHEKRRALELLERADHRSKITKQLELLVGSVELVPESGPNLLRRMLNKVDQMYAKLWLRRSARRAIRIFFLFETALFVGAVSWNIYSNFDDVSTVLAGQVTYDLWLYGGQFVSSVVAACFAIDGALLLKSSRALAFEQFRRATLINLLLTQFFIFSRVELQALAGFFFSLGILLFVSYVINQEHRLNGEASLEHAS